MDGRENRAEAGSSARHVGRALKKKKRRSNVVGSGRRAQPDHKKTRGSQVTARDVALPAERAGARRPGEVVVGKIAGCVATGDSELLDTAGGLSGGGVRQGTGPPAAVSGDNLQRSGCPMQRRSTEPSDEASGGSQQGFLVTSCQCDQQWAVVGSESGVAKLLLMVIRSFSVS